MASSVSPTSDSSDDDQCSSKNFDNNRNSDGFYHFTADEILDSRTTSTAVQRRRRRFTPVRREEVARVRKAGACKVCRKRKVKVSVHQLDKGSSYLILIVWLCLARMLISDQYSEAKHLTQARLCRLQSSLVVLQFVGRNAKWHTTARIIREQHCGRPTSRSFCRPSLDLLSRVSKS